MAKFGRTDATGKAGEHYFAFWVMSNLEWPCRLLDIDIGIDGHIEILNESKHSTGDFIAVQVKTTIKDKPIRSVKKKHLEYWEQLDDPMIYVSITNALAEKPEISWIHLDKATISEYLKKINKEGSNSTSIPENDLKIISEADILNLANQKYDAPLERYIALHAQYEDNFHELLDFFHVHRDEKWEFIQEKIELRLIPNFLSAAELVIEAFDDAEDTLARNPKIIYRTRKRFGIDIKLDTEHMLEIFLQVFEDSEKEEISQWKEFNPNSKVFRDK